MSVSVCPRVSGHTIHFWGAREIQHRLMCIFRAQFLSDLSLLKFVSSLHSTFINVSIGFFFINIIISNLNKLNNRALLF